MTDPTQELKQIRTKRALARYLEDGVYDKKPLDPNYFNNYYHTHKVETQCTHCCKVFVCKQGLTKHLKRSNLCRRIRATETIETPVV